MVKKKINKRVNSKTKLDVSKQFEDKLLEISETFNQFAKLNKYFLKNCNLSFKKYSSIAKEYNDIKTNLLKEKMKYIKLYSFAKNAIKQNQNLRKMLIKTVKIISLKNDAIREMKKGR